MKKVKLQRAFVWAGSIYHPARDGTYVPDDAVLPRDAEVLEDAPKAPPPDPTPAGSDDTVKPEERTEEAKLAAVEEKKATEDEKPKSTKDEKSSKMKL